MKRIRPNEGMLQMLEMSFLYTQYADRFVYYDRRLARYKRLSPWMQGRKGGRMYRYYLMLMRWIYLKEYLREGDGWN